MADENQLEIIRRGVEVWNKWRKMHPMEKVDLKNASLRKANLIEANLCNADLREANLNDALLYGADLRKANLVNATLNGARLCQANISGAYLKGAALIEADLSICDLSNANFSGANLSLTTLRGSILIGANLRGTTLMASDFFRTDLTNADFNGANMELANLVESTLEETDLTNCKVYGISAWALKGTPKNQSSLIITPNNESSITVDDLQVAQFIYLLLNRKNVRNVLNTITSKAVLILGRFTPERQEVLEAIAEELRKHKLLPIIFDFERTDNSDYTETIKTLAGLSVFIIADITNPNSAPLELQATVPDYQIPLVPIIQEGEKPFSMFKDLIGKYDWVLPLVKYKSINVIRSNFKLAIIDRAWKKRKKLQKRKNDALKMLSFDDFTKTSFND